MIKEYKKRLIELAEEIYNIKNDIGGYTLNKYDTLKEKTDYLIGYILALKDLDN